MFCFHVATGSVDEKVAGGEERFIARAFVTKIGWGGKVHREGICHPRQAGEGVPAVAVRDHRPSVSVTTQLPGDAGGDGGQRV